MIKRLGVMIVACLCLAACLTQFSSEPDLFVDFEIIDAPTTPLSPTGKNTMNGVYEVVQGKSILGYHVVGKWVGGHWCMYSEHDAVYSESAGGSSGNSPNDSIKLSGYIRSVRSGSGQRVRLKVLSAEGALEIIADTIPASIRIRGKTEGRRDIELKRIRDLDTSTFHIIAHRGGARNSDRLGISENSIPMIHHAPVLGATGIEIDVKRTRDNKIIVFHDNTFSPRTVQGTYLLGKVENYDLAQIKLLGRLIHGEQIPTLSEALNFVIDNTNLSLVWIDVKDPGVMDQLIQIQIQARSYALAKGRTVEILLGIPSDDALRAYSESPLKDSASILIEGDIETAVSLQTCRIWAPRWTRNVSAEDIARVRGAGKLVFTWDVDIRESILDYMKKVDGILNNYPSLVAGIHYSR